MKWRATGWQRHTMRGVFSSTLKKKLGLSLASAQEERGRVYRIAEPASARSWQSIMRELGSTLAGRRPFPVETAIGNDGARKPGLGGGEAEIAGLLDRSARELLWPGTNCTAPARLWASAATCSSELLPLICKSVPMAARAPRCGVACRAWPERQRKALWPSILVSS